MIQVDQFLAHYGYFAIFGLLMLGIVGPLIPDETILVLSGIAVHSGRLSFLPAVAAAVAGSICGISLSFALGLYGFGWLEEHWPGLHQFTTRRLSKPEAWFRRFGKWTLFFGYFIAGVRHFTALFAGISKMGYQEFAIPAYTGAVCWVLAFVSIGYFVGDQWSRYSSTVDRTIVIAAVAIVALAGIVVLARKRFSSRPSSSQN
jgi:membrane protein DedA with SNARE-associated domain